MCRKKKIEHVEACFGCTSLTLLNNNDFFPFYSKYSQMVFRAHFKTCIFFCFLSCTFCSNVHSCVFSISILIHLNPVYWCVVQNPFVTKLRDYTKKKGTKASKKNQSSTIHPWVTHKWRFEKHIDSRSTQLTCVHFFFFTLDYEKDGQCLLFKCLRKK